jgi:quercetin dioxygenase-like cupin family protein
MKFKRLENLPLEPVSHPPQTLAGQDHGLPIGLPITKRVLLRAGELPHLTNFAQAYFEPGQVAAAHAHGDMVEVFWVQEGTGEILVAGQIQPLGPGVCVVVEPGEQHELRNTGEVKLVLLYFGLQV